MKPLPIPPKGSKIGNFIVVDGIAHPAPPSKSGTHILVECGKCGAESVYSLSYLNSYKFSETSSCKHCSNSSTKYKGTHALSGYYFNQLKKQAEDRGVEFVVDINFLWSLFEKQGRRCALSGIPITLSRSYGKERKMNRADKNKQTASLDRIDSERGYTEDNVQWVHKHINRMKMDLNQDLFIDLCTHIANVNKHKPKAKVITRFSVEGIHRWRKCPIDEVSFLRDYHRHTFNIICYSYVTHSDRDIEFIEMSHRAKKYLTDKYFSKEFQCLFFDDMSCEMIAEELIGQFGFYEVEVNEDNEGGAVVTNI